MSESNAWKHNRQRPPAPDLGELALEAGLRRSGFGYSITTDKRGDRALGMLVPPPAKGIDEWQQQADRHCEVMARGRLAEPTADPSSTTQTLARG